MSIATYQSPWMTEELQLFRSSIRAFIARELAPQQARWREQHGPDVEVWSAAGRAGILLTDVPREYGGAGGTFAHEALVQDEVARAGVHFGPIIQSIVGHYILDYGSEAQKKSILPRLVRGDSIGAIAMSEPAAGSDLQGIKTTARLVGGDYVINGSKTFVSNGAHADVVCVAAKTDPNAAGPTGISLLVVETKNLRGYHVGRSLEKLGRQGQDTCEIFFEDVRIPASSLLGPVPGKGFSQMMKQLPRERLTIAVGAVASTEQAVAITAKYVKERMAFGKPLIDLQNTRFKLAECRTEAHIGRVFLDDCIQRFLAGRLDPVAAAMAKYWLTDCQCKVLDECVQLHGGYGYMLEYPIARMWADARVERIYGGTNEIMKEVIGCSL